MQRAHFEKFFEERGDFLGRVLDYHLILEGLLAAMIEKVIAHPEVLDLERMFFSQKLMLCRALELISDAEFHLLKKMNALRNRFAHRLGYQVNFSDIHTLVREAGAAGIDFSDSVDATDIDSAKSMGYDANMLLNALFRNTFYWIASNQSEDLWRELTS